MTEVNVTRLDPGGEEGGLKGKAPFQGNKFERANKHIRCEYYLM